MRIVAFLDPSLYAQSVIDHTLWLARDRAASVELVQIVSPNELMAAQVAPMHPSVSFPLDSDRVNAQVEKLTHTGRLQLDAARRQLLDAGIDDVSVRLMEGNIAVTMQQSAAGASVLVMGKRGENADLARLPLGSHVERLVRATHVPVLVVSRSFRPIDRMLLPTEDVASPAAAALLAGILPSAAVELLHVGTATEEQVRALEKMASLLAAAGYASKAVTIDGEPRHAIPTRVVLERFDLLAMGGFGGSRLKSMILGSLASEVLRACQVPVLLC